MNAHPQTGKSGIVLRENNGPVAILTLNRPAARNSLSEAMIDGLTAELQAIANDAAIRAIILAANGPAFCAGHDLKELTSRRSDPDGGRAYFHEIMTRCSAMMLTIVALPQPVIAAVQGVATAAGCQLVATCDLAIASTEARFATPGVDIGLFCSTPMVALTRNIARKPAMHMLLTGDPISADDACRLGLINDVAAKGQEREAALALAQRIAAKSGPTVTTGKRAFYRQADIPLAEAYAYAAEVMTENMMSRDANEGICAFIEKRTPVWDGH
jgi:enoyl-CoA hydratase/carnithine racemase